MIAPILLLSLLQTSVNTLTPAEQTAGWRLLFDGRTLSGWRGVGYDTVPTAHWVVVNGAIKKIASGNVPRVADGRPLVGGDLETRDSFADFELAFEWKVTPGANSGVTYNVSETPYFTPLFPPAGRFPSKASTRSANASPASRPP